MAGVQGSALAAAVSNAGGLGSLPCAMLSAQALASELEALRSLTGAPINLNFFCHQMPWPRPDIEAAWLELLSPYFEELEIDPSTLSEGAQRRPFDEHVADIIEPFKPAVISFHFGLPESDLLARVKAWGCKVLSSATTVAEARWLQARGVDAIIAQGLEAGGHRGHFLYKGLDSQLPTLDLVEAIAKDIELPLIAAGGIADAGDVRNALAAGAVAVQVGSAYLLCPEANTSALHRSAIKASKAGDTALTNLYSGRPARGIMTRLMRELGPMSSGAPEFPLASRAVTALRVAAEARGDSSFSPLWAGERAYTCRELGAAELTLELASGFETPHSRRSAKR